MNTLKELQEVRVYSDYLVTRRDIMRAIYKAGLSKDKSFWFLPEPGYLLIRYSKRYQKVIKDFELNGHYACTFEYSQWEEQSDTVAKHSKAFSKIMHECSVIAIEGDFEPQRLFERITHCIFMEFSEAFDKKHNMTYMPEPTVLCHMAVNRAAAEGYASAMFGEVEK